MKRVKELRDLSSEHHRALVIAKKARNATGRSTIGVVWREIEEFYSAELERHFRTEETYLVPTLESLGEQGLVERLRREHSELRSFFQEGASREDDALKRFGTLLAQHARFEERELFNVVQEKFPPEALAAIETSGKT